MDDINFLNNPDQWPNWPMIPVKRPTSSGWPECGVVIDGSAATVFMVNMFELTDGNLNDKIIDCVKHEYESFEAMVTDGWMVD